MNNVFDLKSKKLNYELMLSEIINADKSEINGMFFAEHNFSIMNKILAMTQCHAQGFKYGLLQCMSKWHAQNRFKKQHAKKLWLRLPVTYKLYDKITNQPLLDDNGKQKYGHGYKFANNWLCYDQTIGDEIKTKELNTIFDFDKTLKNLLITKIDFDYYGDCGGYAMVAKRELAVNPAWHNTKDVAKTMFHEIAHIVLKHDLSKPTNQKELEAELTAMMLAKIFDLDCKEQSAYIKSWIKENYSMLDKETYKTCLQACELIVKASKSNKPIIKKVNNDYVEIKGDTVE